MSTTSSREEALFSEALALPAAARGAFLDEACGADFAMRARVAALLGAHESSHVDLPVVDRSALTRVAEEKSGDVIGRYKLLQKIGEGGCGVVWMAEQEEPVRRRVALKVIKLGMDTKTVVARFEAERQALAMMDHPNIAKVHDGGATESGRPFFVMELVRGIPITRFCDDNNLPTRDRLELFIKVCHAIQHAHQKGIIHRDIKPSNVLVTLHDDEAVPMVIDFGIAKATQGRLTDQTLFTAFEQFLGTPVYMSPEQAEFNALDVDTRSDIYSLGVLLYELLTGRPPFDPKVLRDAGLEQIRRIIRETEPPRPSTRVRTLTDAERTTVAKLRGIAPAHLSTLLRGDLDWIVLKALEKNRVRRYQTANAFAMDIQRSLANEVVVARPPSAAYRLRKFITRHKVGFITSVAATVLLVGGFAFSTFSFVREKEAKRLALAQELVARRKAYASDMAALQQALSTEDLGRARALLDRQRPEPGQVDLRGWEWRYLWQFCQGDAQTFLARLPSGINSLAASADGKWLAAGEQWDGAVSIWNPGSGEEIRVTSGSDIVRVAFSPRDPVVAIASAAARGAEMDFGVVLWSLTTREPIRILPLTSYASGLFFSADGETLVTSTVGTANTITVWRVADGEKIASHPTVRPEGQARWSHFIVSDDHTLAAYGSWGDGRIRVVDLATGEERWSARAADERVMALRFSPDGRLLASGAGMTESTIRFWDVASGEPRGELEGHRRFVSQLAFLPNGKTLVSASGDQTVRVWDIDKRQLLRTLRGHENEVWSLTLLPDERLIVSGSKDGTIILWDLDRPAFSATTVLPGRPIAWRFGRSSDSIVVAYPDRLVQRGGQDYGEETPLMPLPAGSEDVVLDARAPLVAHSRGPDANRMEVWDWEKRVRLHEIALEQRPVIPFQFIDSGRKLLLGSGSLDGFRINEWDLAANRETRSWSLPAQSRQLTLAPDETRAVSFAWGGAYFHLDLGTGRASRLDIDLRRQLGSQSAFSPDGKLFVATSQFGIAHVIDATSSTFREIETLRGLAGFHSAAFAPDGQRLATGSSSGEAMMLWDTEEFERLLVLGSNSSLFHKTAFSADGNVLGSANGLGAGGALTLWRAPSWEEIERAERQAAARSTRFGRTPAPQKGHQETAAPAKPTSASSGKVSRASDFHDSTTARPPTGK